MKLLTEAGHVRVALPQRVNACPLPSLTSSKVHTQKEGAGASEQDTGGRATWGKNRTKSRNAACAIRRPGFRAQI